MVRIRVATIGVRLRFCLQETESCKSAKVVTHCNRVVGGKLLLIVGDESVLVTYVTEKEISSAGSTVAWCEVLHALPQVGQAVLKRRGKFVASDGLY